MKNNLLTDYLNKNSHILDEKVIVKGAIDEGNYVRALIEWEDEEAIHSANVEISLFDLISFMYSKNQEK